MKKLSAFLLATAVLLSATASNAHLHNKHKKEMDTNGDKLISKEEFLSYHENNFDVIDANGDGLIDKKEFKNRNDAMKHHMHSKKKTK